MGAPSKRATKVRSASEFDVARLMSALAPPRSAASVYAWTLPEIFSARDEQMRGQFSLPVKLAASMRTDDAIFVARANRLAPQRCIRVEIVPARGARAVSIAAEAGALYGQGGVAITPGALADINGCLVDHGVAFARNVLTAREDGSRVDVAVEYWPIEHVRWDAAARCFKTRTESGVDVPIVHGDGRWIIFQSFDHEPFKQEAAVLAASLVWARHAFGLRDWAKSSVAHGSAKVVGEMPEGVALQNAEGLTPEAAAMLELLRLIATSDAPVGIRPSGSKTDFLANTSTAWQIFDQLVAGAEKAAARIYLGTDGTLGSQGGAPGVDIQALFGVALTKVQGDLAAIERGLATGSIEIWCAINFGDSKLAPTRRYMIPDADADAHRASIGTRRAAFFLDIKEARQNGFDITQKYVDAIARSYDIDPPMLKPPPPPATVDVPVAAPAASPAAAPSPVVAPPPALRLVPPPEPAPPPKADAETKAALAALSSTVRAIELAVVRERPDTMRALAALDDRVTAIASAPRPLTFAERNAAYFADMRDIVDGGFILDQARADELAARHDVPPARLAKPDDKSA